MDTDDADNRPNAGSRPPFLWPDTVVVDCDECGRETRLFAVRRPTGLFWRGSAELDETLDIYDSPVCGGCGGLLATRAAAARAARDCGLGWLLAGSFGFARGLAALVARVAGVR